MTNASESNDSDSGNNVLDVLSGNFPVVLTHDVNGGYLRPDALNPDHHSGEARATKTLDDGTKNANGHLWYLTEVISASFMWRVRVG